MIAWLSRYGRALVAAAIGAAILAYCIPHMIAHRELERQSQPLLILPDSCADFIDERRDSSNRVQRTTWSRYRYSYQLGDAHYKGEGVTQGSCPRPLGRITILYRFDDHSASTLATSLDERARSLYYGLAVGAVFLLAALAIGVIEARAGVTRALARGAWSD